MKRKSQSQTGEEVLSPGHSISELSPRDETFTLIGILLALFLGALDQTIVATALPRIVTDLKGLDRFAWVATAYLLASTVLVPVYGKLSDLFSRKTIEVIAICLFLSGSFLCGLSGQFGSLSVLGDGMSQLIVFRALQGAGGAGLFALAFIVIADLFPPAVRGRYQGLVGGTFGLASVLGPLAGGFLTDFAGSLIPGIAGWRWVFYVNLPFGAIALCFIITRMPALLPRTGAGRLNFPSVFLLIAAVAPLILALELDKTRYPWASRTTLLLFAVSVAGLAVFMLIVAKVKDPILDLRLFKNRVFATAIPALFLLNVAFLSLLVFLPLFMVNVLGVSSTGAGISLIPISIGLVTGSVISGQLVSRFGRYRFLMLCGIAMFLFGVFLLSRMTIGVSYRSVTLYMVICGLGLGPSLPLYTLAIQNAVEVRRIGQATSASQFFRQIGGTVGIAIMGTVLASMLAASFSHLTHVPGMERMSGPFHRSETLSAPPDVDDISRQIRSEFDRQYALAERVILDDDRQALKQLQEDLQLPRPVKELLDSLTDPNTPGPDEPAKRRALLEIKTALSKQSELLIAGVSAEIRVAFAEAVTRIYLYLIFIIAAALAVTFFIPELPLRRSNEPPVPGTGKGNSVPIKAESPGGASRV